MADAGDGFVGRCEVVEPRRGNRRWPLDLKARIVAESFQPGVRVVDVARRHGVVEHQFSDWRGQAWECLLILPLNMCQRCRCKRKDVVNRLSFRCQSCPNWRWRLSRKHLPCLFLRPRFPSVS
jgi:hypothetical protein